MPGNESTWTRDLLDAPHSAADKAGRVRRMFNEIAPRYELINTLFSAGRDAAWRRKAVELADVQRDDVVLDVACGTGDFAREIAKAGPQRVIGCDFAHEMLARAVGLPGRGSNPSSGDSAQHQSSHDDGHHAGSAVACEPGESPRLLWCEADALDLPFQSGSFSLVSSAFGVRNFQDLDTGLSQMRRILRPGGRAVILEFTRPANPVARLLYELYANRFMPLAASLISRDRAAAYRYLPRSVVSFLGAQQMCARLRRVGFSSADATPRTMGIVTIYVARNGEK